MFVTIQPSSLSGTILAPASKSSMQRACATALLTNGVSIIKNPGHSNDDKAALRVIESMGATWELKNGNLEITSHGLAGKPFTEAGETAEVNCGESGLGIRMFAPIIALSKNEITINGEGSLLKRPIDFFDEVLPKLGVDVQTREGKLPLKLKGPLQPRNIEIDGSLSSQFLTGLLIAFAATGAHGVSIRVKNLKSKPYIDLTLDVMDAFKMGVPANRNYEEFSFYSKPNVQSTNNAIHYTVEGDWSGAAFLLVAGAIAGDIVIKGLDTTSSQADKVILDALRNCGAKLSIKAAEIEIGTGNLKPFYFDATECPDLIPPLVALASYCDGKTSIKGTSRLIYKESNRAESLKQEFGKMGIHVELQSDLMIVHGGENIVGAKVHSHHDHRIAMACAVAALRAKGQTNIEEADAVNKSYPDFYEHFLALGAKLVVENSAINVR